VDANQRKPEESIPQPPKLSFSSRENDLVTVTLDGTEIAIRKNAKGLWVPKLLNTRCSRCETFGSKLINVTLKGNPKTQEGSPGSAIERVISGCESCIDCIYL
jgi:hypothetical protein